MMQPTATPKKGNVVVPSKSRRITLSPPGILIAPTTNTNNKRKTTTATNDEHAAAKKAQGRWETLCPAVHQDLSSILSSILSSSGANRCQALADLTTILQEEPTNQQGTTRAIFFSGKHLDLGQCLTDDTNDHRTLELALQALHQLVSRRGYYHVPEVLGVSCLITSLVLAGTIEHVLAALHKLLTTTENKNKEHIVKLAFEMVEDLLLGQTFVTMVQLGVPRQALDLVTACPNDQSLALAVARLVRELVQDGAAAEPSNWKEHTNNNHNSLLQDVYHGLVASYDRHRSDDILEAVQSVDEIYNHNNNHNDEEMTANKRYLESINKEN